MQTIELKVITRDASGKGVARKIRRDGGLPGVVYGVGVENTRIQVPVEELRKFSAAVGHNMFLKLKVDGPLDGKMSLISDFQRDPLTRRLLHTDLRVVDMSKPIVVEIPLIFEGAAPGQKEGGIITHARREIEVRCLPTEIPEGVVVDLSHLNIGDSIHLNDLELPEGIESVSDTNITLVTVSAPVAEEEVKPAEDEEGALGEEGAEPAEGEEGEKAASSEADGANKAGASKDKKDKKDK